MFSWLQQIIATSWQKKLKDLLQTYPFWAYVSVVFFVLSFLHLMIQLIFGDRFTLSLLFTIVSTAVASLLFTIRLHNKQGWLTGSWLTRTCIELWNHDEDKE